MRRVVILGLIGTLVFMFAGCGGTIMGLQEVKQVNEAAITGPPPSYTDDVSRLAAMNSLKDLGQKSEDYRVGPEDLLEVSIFEWELREETKTAAFRVSESGYVSLPVIGSLLVGDQTVAQIRRTIEDKLREGGFIQQPRVSVDIREYRSKKVAVVGSVRDPGVYTLRQNVTTLLDILSLAGGITEKAGHLAYVIRPPEAEEKAGKDQEVVNIDLYRLMEKGDLSLNMVLGNGDMVNVPEAATYSVIGYVRKPGNFPIKRPITVLEGIAEAGGLIEREAAPSDCVLKRHFESGTARIPLNLVAIVQGEMPNMYLRQGDVIEVGEDVNRKFMTGFVDFIKGIFNITYHTNSNSN